MALWTVTDIDSIGQTGRGMAVRLRLSGDATSLTREVGRAEALALRRQLAEQLRVNPAADSFQIQIGEDLYPVDLGSAASLLARLPAGRRPRLHRRGRGWALIFAVAIMLALLAGWAMTYWVHVRSVRAANIELAGQVLQNPRTDRTYLAWAVDLLADNADIAISSERRARMIAILSANPETSFGTIIEVFGSEFPEFRSLAEQPASHDKWVTGRVTGPQESLGSAAAGGASDAAPDGVAGKQFIDRIPHSEGEQPSGQGQSPDQAKGLSQTLYPKAPADTDARAGR